jgi:hypothetical protein
MNDEAALAEARETIARQAAEIERLQQALILQAFADYARARPAPAGVPGASW